MLGVHLQILVDGRVYFPRIGTGGQVQKLLENFSNEFGRSGVEVFTIEGRIIIHLLNNGSSRIKELLHASGSSYRGFYLAIERLKAKGLVTADIDPNDRRARLIRLNEIPEQLRMMEAEC